jgi:hypothetical protein
MGCNGLVLRRDKLSRLCLSWVKPGLSPMSGSMSGLPPEAAVEPTSTAEKCHKLNNDPDEPLLALHPGLHGFALSPSPASSARRRC